MENTLSPLIVDTQNAPLREHDAKSMPLPRDAERLASLDAFRGFIMLWIIGGEGLMVGLAALGHNRVIDTVVYELSHTPWQGPRFYDCIWPCFMLMVGISYAVFCVKKKSAETNYHQSADDVRRTTLLLLIASANTWIC